MKLLIATNNKAKRTELSKITNILPGIEVVFPENIGIVDEPEETGKTFCENSELKVRWYAKKSNLPTLADDGGIEIDVLNGAPGVHSKRWLGYDADDEEIIAYTIQKLKPFSNRTARLTTCLSFFDPLSQKIVFEQASIEGYMADKPSEKRINGFPYRSLFIVSRFNKYYDELTDEEHTQINHRRIALKKICEKLHYFVK